jgi:hypothetical protein
VSATWENGYIKDRSKASILFKTGKTLSSVWRRITLKAGKYRGFISKDTPKGYGTMHYTSGDRF